MFCSFFYISTFKSSMLLQLLILDHDALSKRGKYFPSLLIWKQNLSKLSRYRCNTFIYMIMIYYWEKKLKKRLHVLEVYIITVKRNIDLMSLAERMYLLLYVVQMTAIVPVSVIDHYHINWCIYFETPCMSVVFLFFLILFFSYFFL